jgi:hypothetical protein
LAFGTVTLVVAPLALMVGGFLAERLAKRGYDDANLRVQLLAICLWIPGAVLMPMMPTPMLALAVSRRPKPCGSSPFSMPPEFQRVVESGLSAFSRDKWLCSRSDGNLPKGPMAQRSDTRGSGFPG